MSAQRRQLMPSTARGLIAAVTCFVFLSALALNDAPRWHEVIHPDANSAQHECAVTLIGAGNYHQPAPGPLVAVPVPVCHFSFTPALHPIWVASPFIGARVFEHAPPALV